MEEQKAAPSLVHLVVTEFIVTMIAIGLATALMISLGVYPATRTLATEIKVDLVVGALYGLLRSYLFARVVQGIPRPLVVLATSFGWATGGAIAFLLLR